VAKKSRTPAPPRKVQAPQRRVEQRRPRTAEERKTLWISIAFAASGVAAIAIVGLLFFVFGRGGGSAPKAVNESQLIGLQTGPAPWNAGLDHLPDRMKPLGMSELGAEGQGVVQHIHMHLDVFVNGKKKTVPALIGIYNTAGGFITDLHTHDTTGIIHLESPSKTRKFSLSEFFGVWGVRFTPKCVGGYCKPQTQWTLYVNGKPYQGDPTKLVFQKHQELALVIGKPPANVPSTYAFGGL
jgi:hypothetical protein